jgi:hypothetical protein
MSFYCSLAEAREELLATSNTADDNRLLRYVRMVSRRINKIMTGQSQRAYFWPVIKEEQVPLDGRHINSAQNLLLLRGLPPLLEIDAVTADGSDISTTVSGYPLGVPFFDQLHMSSSGSGWYSYLCSNGGDPAYAAIAGVWGYHSDYPNAWVQVDALAAQQTADAGNFTVADADGADQDGITPRFSPGMLVKIDDEVELVTAVNTTTNVVTATRHQNGTEAAVHAAAEPVYVWQTEDPIRRVTARQAALMVARRGAFQTETVDGVGTVSYPQDLLNELAEVLTEYINAR